METETEMHTEKETRTCWGTDQIKDLCESDADFDDHSVGGIEDRPGEGVIVDHQMSVQPLFVRHDLGHVDRVLT